MVTVPSDIEVVKDFDRQEVFEDIVDRVQDVTCSVLSSILNEELDAEVTEGLQRGFRRPRSASGDTRTPWACHGCGTKNASDFVRDGHYPRELQTTFGALDQLRMPMVECTCCEASADIDFNALPKHKRFWLDINEQVLLDYGFDAGLRQIAQRLALRLGSSPSPATIQRRVHAAKEALQAWRQASVEGTYDVLMIDGIWFKSMEETGETARDSLNRQYPKQSCEDRVAIVVLGICSETTDRQILDFEIAAAENEDDCTRLLNRLHCCGVTEDDVKLIVSDGAGGICAAIETVYPTVDHQRCIFHKLKNVRDNLEDNDHQKAILDEASKIYEAESVKQAVQRLQKFVSSWEDSEPDAVASLQKDFDASITYLHHSQVEDARRFRTTNHIEGGVMSPLRDRLDRATVFRSPCGAQVVFFLAIMRLNANRRDEAWGLEAKEHIKTLYTSDP